MSRLEGALGKRAFERHVDHVRALERALTADGTELLKLWIHLPAQEHAKRLLDLAGANSADFPGTNLLRTLEATAELAPPRFAISTDAKFVSLRFRGPDQ